MKNEFLALTYSAMVIMAGAIGLIYTQPDPFWPSFSGAFIQALSGAVFVTIAIFFLYAYLVAYGVLVLVSRRLRRFRPLIVAVPSWAYFSIVYLHRFGELSAVAAAIGAATFSGVALAQFYVFRTPSQRP